MQDEPEELQELTPEEQERLAEELGLEEEEEDGFSYLAEALAGFFQAQNTLISQLIESQKLIIFELRKLNSNFASAKLNTGNRG